MLELSEFFQALADLVTPTLLDPHALFTIGAVQSCVFQYCAQPASYVHEPPFQTKESATSSLLTRQYFGSELCHAG